MDMSLYMAYLDRLIQVSHAGCHVNKEIMEVVGRINDHIGLETGKSIVREKELEKQRKTLLIEVHDLKQKDEVERLLDKVLKGGIRSNPQEKPTANIKHLLSDDYKITMVIGHEGTEYLRGRMYDKTFAMRL